MRFKGFAIAFLGSRGPDICCASHPRSQIQHQVRACVAMAPKGRRGVLVTTSKTKKVQQEEDDRLESQKEWDSCKP